MSKPADNFTMVRIRRTVLELARTEAKKVDRSIANYIEHLVKEDSRKAGKKVDF
jgi:ribosomal protein S17E